MIIDIFTFPKKPFTPKKTTIKTLFPYKKNHTCIIHQARLVYQKHKFQTISKNQFSPHTTGKSFLIYKKILNTKTTLISSYIAGHLKSRSLATCVVAENVLVTTISSPDRLKS